MQLNFQPEFALFEQNMRDKICHQLVAQYKKTSAPNPIYGRGHCEIKGNFTNHG